MSEINGQTDDVALLVNWFFCSPFPPYENLKVDMALGEGGPGGEGVKPPPPGVEGQQGGHCDGLHHPAAGFFFFFCS